MTCIYDCETDDEEVEEAPRCRHEEPGIADNSFRCSLSDSGNTHIESDEYLICHHCLPSFPCFSQYRGNPDQYNNFLCVQVHINPYQYCAACQSNVCDGFMRGKYCKKCEEGRKVALNIEQWQNLAHLGHPYQDEVSTINAVEYHWKKLPLLIYFQKANPLGLAYGQISELANIVELYLVL